MQIQNNYKLIIVGGGSSGLMTAVSAIKYGKVRGEEILIIEKNSVLGKKLKITGGGRCNVYNAEYNTNALLNNYGINKKYLHSAFTSFAADESREFFKELGLETKVEDRKRAFPVSEKAIDVYESMYKFIEQNNVKIILNAKVEKFNLQENTEKNIIQNVIINKEVYIADKYVLATGGYSHPETGSTGDGFAMINNLNKNVKINKPNPSLVPLLANDKWIHSLSGKTIENIKIIIKVDDIKKKVIKHSQNLETKNRMLFTHFGLSGPTILNLSKEINSYLSEGEVVFYFDLFPEMDESKLDKFILEIFDNNKNKKIKNILNQIYDGNVLESILGEYVINLDLGKPVNDVKKDERRMMINTLKNLRVKIDGLMGYDKAIIADGGVDASEVDFKDMSLYKIVNLHVTGDMLDISRPSGGYSLQLCWTSGFLAGR